MAEWLRKVEKVVKVAEVGRVEKERKLKKQAENLYYLTRGRG